MALADLITGPELSGCIVGRWYQGLPDGEREAFDLLAKRKTAVELLAAAKAHAAAEYGISALRGHLRGDCACADASAAA